jgi:hypothetical protein
MGPDEQLVRPGSRKRLKGVPNGSPGCERPPCASTRSHRFSLLPGGSGAGLPADGKSAIRCRLPGRLPFRSWPGAPRRCGRRARVVRELGLAGFRFWQSLFEAAGRGRGELEMAIVFTGLMEFSSWALEAGDAATLELLREVGSAAKTSIVAHEGRIVSGSVTA